MVFDLNDKHAPTPNLPSIPSNYKMIGLVLSNTVLIGHCLENDLQVLKVTILEY
jgi:hypothetical protein